MKRFRYRKIDPVKAEEMVRLHKQGLTYEQIAEKFDVSFSTVQYHVSPEQREKAIKRAHESLERRHPDKLPHRNTEYLRNYMRDRYQNDLEFRERMIKANVIQSKKYGKRHKEEGLCRSCPKPLSKNSKRLCDCHLAKKREYQRKRRLKCR